MGWVVWFKLLSKFLRVSGERGWRNKNRILPCRCWTPPITEAVLKLGHGRQKTHRASWVCKTSVIQKRKRQRNEHRLNKKEAFLLGKASQEPLPRVLQNFQKISVCVCKPCVITGKREREKKRLAVGQWHCLPTASNEGAGESH